ncbi:shikimate kinase [Blattabacterium cuenoti]|uniref:shikimate kinase n=1 Tax=Blattabacterium cuenoti TaxID=1653831 RepID=UPI00163BB19F|nr:shikimate kinase [Blattabacterium cuenoti]
MKITLIGYMACGKTTIGNMLSKKIKLNFYDLDDLLIKEIGSPIDNIFKTKGEKFFRKMEHIILKKFLKDKNKQYVLSVGGGTPCYYNNIDLLNKYSKTFYLKENISVLFDRLYKNKKHRPLISNLNKKELLNFLNNHFSKRIHFYEQSLTKINIHGKSKLEIVQKINNILYKNAHFK